MSLVNYEAMFGSLVVMLAAHTKGGACAMDRG